MQSNIFSKPEESTGRVCLFTTLERVGCDILEIRKLHPSLKNITAVFPKSAFPEVKSVNVMFKGINIDATFGCTLKNFDNVYVSNDFGVIPMGIENQKAIILGDSIVKRITYALQNGAQLSKGNYPSDSDACTRLKDLVKGTISIADELIEVTKVEELLKNINSPYIYFSQIYSASEENVTLPSLGETRVIIGSIEANSRYFYIYDTNSSEFYAKRKSYQGIYRIYQAVPNNEENMINLLTALECLRLREELTEVNYEAGD